MNTSHKDLAYFMTRHQGEGG